VSLDSVLEELVFGEETRELSTVTGVSDKMLLNKLSKRMADKNQAVFYFLKLLKGQLTSVVDFSTRTSLDT
jgi:hypothetical protein